MKSIKKRKILIAEDEKPMARALEAKGYFVKSETPIMEIIKIVF